MIVQVYISISFRKKEEIRVESDNVGGMTYWMFGYGLSYGEDAGTTWFSGFGSFFVTEAGAMQGGHTLRFTLAI